MLLYNKGQLITYNNYIYVYNKKEYKILLNKMYVQCFKTWTAPTSSTGNCTYD